MNLAIIGYGKMGKAIEKIAKIRKHNINYITSSKPEINKLKNVDVAIEFTKPESAFENLKICLEQQIPIVCGTTGWLKKLKIIENICIKKNGTFLYSSNFSISMNIFFKINLFLAKLMSSYIQNYNIKIDEIHHKNKLDKPSGTAIFLAEDIINVTDKTDWILFNNNINKINNDKIPIVSKRIENTIGTHIVKYYSNIDNIEIKHEAYNRDGFALGAIIAAEWIKNKKGIFYMNEVLNI
ncbi:MAG: 4-hydroxy-tetrahydrodipicolinate reductase [Candidatus Bostrichicola ureolyticus]|nr:MAG: 4-hydroxy-tetrahydrodipicolinate reductase [Candidatus Bostrichicola ureolyticus]